ncbi:hypothetical protein ABZ137_37985 [Streptomyces bobili]|uniref:hypothetical protein n=1 Tax=Streptomyces bobili TaxID=67280 RepID=UPI0033ABE43C
MHTTEAFTNHSSQRGVGELVLPIQAAVNFSFIPIELDHPHSFGVAGMLIEEDGFRISLTEAFAR